MSTTAASPASRWLPACEWTVYGLLAVSIVLFLVNETVTEGLNSLARDAATAARAPAGTD
ncbi:hypothetical protein [Thiohalocapsa halophila]